jgi:radical SAM protein with 4Fe4S-binding SPASM domain
VSGLRELREIKIELTQECPLACVHCSTNSNRKQTSALPKDVILRLLREAAELGVTKVVFTGGEPLISPSLFDAVALASSLGMSATVYTSGILDNHLNPMSLDLAIKLVNAGVARFIFSVYSDRSEIHDSVTRYGTHRATLEALKNALATRVAVEIHFVAMRRNFRDLPGVVAFADSVGVGKLSVLRFVPQGRGTSIADRDDLRNDELRELADTISSLRADYSRVTIRAGSPFNILGIGNSPCNAAQDVLIINHRGEIFPCDAFKNVRYSDDKFGSVLTKSIREVWAQSSFLNEVRTILASAKGETCGACELTKTCQSGCLAQKIIREGWSAVRSPDPSCLLQKRQANIIPELIQIAV